MLEYEQVPSRVVAVPAPRGQREGTDNRRQAHGLEERRLLDGVEEFILLGRPQSREVRRLPPARGAAVQIGDPFRKKLLLVRVERGERPIDEIHNACFM